MDILSANDIANTLKVELNRIKSELMESYKSSVKTNIDFEYGEKGFCVRQYLLTDGTDIEVRFKADISTKDIYKGEIVEFSNISISQIETVGICDILYLDLDNSDALLEVGKEIALNANFYRLVDKKTVTTDDLDATYSEMSEQYEKYGY